MAYGHAERTLATIRLLEAETRELLARREHLDPDQAEWLAEAAESASRRLCTGSGRGAYYSLYTSQFAEGPTGPTGPG